MENMTTTSPELSKISNVVDNTVVKKTVNEKLVIKVNAIDFKVPGHSGLVCKAQYVWDKQGLEKLLGLLTKNTWY